MAHSIPIPDLASLRSVAQRAFDRLGQELRRAFTEISFYCARSHGILGTLLDQTFAEVSRFHGQPSEAKLAHRINDHNFAYMPMRGATMRVNAVGDVALPNANEAVFFKRDLPADHPDIVGKLSSRGTNQRPDLPGFWANILEACLAFEGLGLSISPLYARALACLPITSRPFSGADVHAALVPLSAAGAKGAWE
jgi:isopenicillin N synthase-like dioxygenase